MKILKRKHMNKYRGAKKFRHHAKHTKAANIQSSPQRGGWRL